MAARLISKDQPLVMGVYYPRGVYSRVVGLHVIVPAGLGNGDFGVTPVLAGELWLLRADIWTQRRNLTDLIGGFIWLRTNTVKDPVSADFCTRGESIIDMSTVSKEAIYFVGAERHWSFEMNRHYSGGPRRFGISVSNGYDVVWDVFATFQISEG